MDDPLGSEEKNQGRTLGGPGSQDSGAAGIGLVDADIVPTKKKRRAPAHWGPMNAARQLRAVDRSLQLKELVCEHGFSISKAARELGISRRHATAMWQVWVERIRRAKEGSLPEQKAAENDVRVYCEHNIRGVIERCAAMIEVNPSYAAGVLRGIELLAKVTGVNIDNPAGPSLPPGSSPLESILAQAQSTAGKQILGLAVDVEALVEAEREIEDSPITRGLNNSLRKVGGEWIPPSKGAEE